MKKAKRKKNRLLTAIAIVFIMIFLIPPLAICGVFWGLAHDDYKGTDHYSDGTVVYHGNGPKYDHVLFDYYSVSFEGEGRSSVRRITPGYEASFDRAEINKFTFDKNGFIEYHVADENINEYRLFSAENESIQIFSTMKELHNFCTKNNINLGPWYHSLYLEQTFFNQNGWTLTTDSSEASHIRHNGEELFSGQIDKYFFTPRYLFFKFQHFETNRYDEEPNPVIPIDYEISVGKRIGRFFPFREDIHTEKYICIDTETNKYTIYDDEDSFEKYAASLGISQNWEKIKFDEKVNN